MHWNHRVIRHDPTEDGPQWYGIHEVFYDDEGNPRGCTDTPVKLVGDSRDELAWTLDKMRTALDKPVLNMSMFEEMEGEHGPVHSDRERK